MKDFRNWAAVLVLACGLAGCSGASRDAEPSYGEALQTHTTETEILRGLLEERAAVIRHEEARVATVRNDFSESLDQLSSPEAMRKALEELSPLIDESIAKIRENQKEILAEIDEDITEQREKVARAKADLDAADARRKQE